MGKCDIKRLEEMCSLFLDKEIGRAVKEGHFENADEEFGVLVFCGRQFEKVYVILKEGKEESEKCL